MAHTESGHEAQLDPHLQAAEQAFRAVQRTEALRRESREAQLSVAESFERIADRTGPQGHMRKQPDTAIGRTNTGNARLATASSHRRTAGWLSSCDKNGRNGARRAIPPPDLRAIAETHANVKAAKVNCRQASVRRLSQLST